MKRSVPTIHFLCNEHCVPVGHGTGAAATAKGKIIIIVIGRPNAVNFVKVPSVLSVHSKVVQLWCSGYYGNLLKYIYISHKFLTLMNHHGTNVLTLIFFQTHF